MKKMRMIAAILMLTILSIVLVGCLTRSVTANGVTAKETQFLIFSNLGEFTISTNGTVTVGNYITQADTNGMEKMEQIIERAVTAAVKAAIASGLAANEYQAMLMFQQNPMLLQMMMSQSSMAHTPVSLGTGVMRVQSFNGKPGLYDVQIVPVADDPVKAAK